MNATIGAVFAAVFFRDVATYKARISLIYLVGTMIMLFCTGTMGGVMFDKELHPIWERERRNNLVGPWSFLLSVLARQTINSVLEVVARLDSAEDFCRLKAPCTAMGWIFIPAHCFAFP